MSDKMQKYLGQWIPVSKWVRATNSKDMDVLALIRTRLEAQEIAAVVALDKGHCCVYREVMEHDINVIGGGSKEWDRSIQMHAVKDVNEARYTREHNPRKTG